MFSALVKIALVALSVLLGKRSGKRLTDAADRDPEPEAVRDSATEWARTLDLFFSFALVGSIAWAIGALRVGPLESRGYDAIGELIGLLLLFGFKCLLFVVLPATLLYMLLRSFEGLGVRLVVYGFFALIGFGAWHFAGQRDESQQRVQAATQMREQMENDQKQREAESMEQARVIAERKEQEEHEKAVSRLLELTLQTHERWLEDLRASGAIGFERDPPPMLHIVDDGLHQKKITNLTSKKVCVKITRVMRHPGSQDYLRCPQDRVGDCVEISRGASALFNVYPHGNNEACRTGQLEYRVGTPLQPEPSWWSLSALADLDVRAVEFEPRYAAMTTLDLRSEILRLETMLEETDRAERWKREAR
jgi:hypothetical protein